MNRDLPDAERHAAGGSRERLRVAIIPAAFDSHLHYQENIFASTIHEMGHDLVVFTSYYRGGGNPSEIARTDAALPYRVIRSERILRWRDTQFPWDRAIQGAIHEFDPDVAIVLAPNHGLGVFWIRCLPEKTRVIAVFSDLPWHRGILSTWFKSRWTKVVVRRAFKVITVTEQTDHLIRKWSDQRDHYKFERQGLAFCPNDFSCGTLPRSAAELASRVRRVIACVTRVSPVKQLDVLFRSVERYLISDIHAGFVFAGFGEDEESGKLRARISSSIVSDRCVILPMLNGGEIGEIFRIAHCSVWSLVSIGIYHSLHCGCPVLLREGQDASHLLVDPANGRTFPSLDRLQEPLRHALDRPLDRALVSESVESYHAPVMFEKLLNEIRVN